MGTKKKDEIRNMYNVFVSSTYTDMIPYREAIRNAIIKANCHPAGMEQIPATSISPLESCFEELEQCQIFICALGMRYGTIDRETGMSYTQLEYEKAVELEIPILAFLIDEDNTSFKISQIDTGEAWEKLSDFKTKIKESKQVTCAFFDSPMALQETVYRSLLGEIMRKGGYSSQYADNTDDYIEGATLFKRFVKRPEKYRDMEAVIRVRMDGPYGGWRLREEVYRAFGFVPGEAMFINDLYTLGCNVDVDEDLWRLDCFADGDAADWLDENDVTMGTVFEGRFRLAFELVEKGAGSRTGIPVDAKIANMILLEGIRIIKHGTPTSNKKSKEDKLIELLFNAKKRLDAEGEL